MPSDPPLHVALGPDLRRPSVRLFKVIPLYLDRSRSPTMVNILLVIAIIKCVCVHVCIQRTV